MPHIILAAVTIAIVRFAWVNFKQLGTLRTQTDDEGRAERERMQMTYVMRILASLLALAVAPFLFTLFTK